MRDDHVSAASELLPRAAARVEEALERVGPGPAPLAAALLEVVREQPALGAVHRLVSRALAVARTAAASGLAASAASREIRDAARAFVADYEAASTRIVERAATELLPAEGFVATCSRSSLVEQSFLEAHRSGKRCGALVAESRPLGEGRQLAETLAAAGVPVLFATDAALPGLLGGAEGILIGADAVLPRTFLHKVGTTALLLAARESGLPAHALAQEAKFLPAEAAFLDLMARDPKQVWAEAPEAVRVLNPTFEEVDLRLLRGVASERTVLPPGEVSAIAGETLLDPELAKRGGNGDLA